MGKEEQLAAGTNDYAGPKISPDGTKVALSIRSSASRDIWIWDLVHKTLTRLTFDSAFLAGSPLWTPDGKRVAFMSKDGIYWKAADGTGNEEFLVSAPDRAVFPASWADNGKTMVIADWHTSTMDFDIGTMSMEGARKSRLLLKEKYHEAQPQISPDGRYMAYTSNESGQNQIYVRPFPQVEGGRWQVSTTGGDSPLWSPNGRELFYRNGDSVMAVSVKTAPIFNLETPKTLFRGTYVNAVFLYGSWDFTAWDISPDGKRFLMMKEAGTGAGGGPRKINVVLNWFEELKQRVPVK
jgi:serine/threonine-protein kinase